MKLITTNNHLRTRSDTYQSELLSTTFDSQKHTSVFCDDT